MPDTSKRISFSNCGSVPHRFAWPVLLFCDILAAIFVISFALQPDAIRAPRLVLWAWERPEDLRFIDAATTGVAYLAATVALQPDGTPRFHFRQQPLLVPQAASMMAVIRIVSPPRYVLPDPAQLAASLAEIANRPGLQGLQIDYDARASERSFYRALLSHLHSQTHLPIGITALVSWCDGDAWLGAESLSEAVPMFFRMGRGESKAMAIHARSCAGAVGLSTDEAWPAHRPSGLRDSARVYVFNPHPWTRLDYDLVTQRLKEWK